MVLHFEKSNACGEHVRVVNLNIIQLFDSIVQYFLIFKVGMKLKYIFIFINACYSEQSYCEQFIHPYVYFFYFLCDFLMFNQNVITTLSGIKGDRISPITQDFTSHLVHLNSAPENLHSSTCTFECYASFPFSIIHYTRM